MKVIVSLSGGMDSATLLGLAVSRGCEVSCVGFTYGSKHNEWENRAAVQVADYYQVPFRLLDLSGVMSGFKSDLLLSGGDIPEGHYEDHSMARTVVPARNLIFSSVLTGVAWSEGAGEVWVGVHAGDHAIYPDCRPEWYQAMMRAVRLGTDERVLLQAPFLFIDKTEILRRGLDLKVPYQLTRTCYKHQEVACGRCGSCQERLTSFAAIGIEDPIAYQSREIMPKEQS